MKKISSGVKSFFVFCVMAFSLPAMAEETAWHTALMNQASTGFAEHKIALLAVAGFLLVAIIFRNSLMSLFSMLSNLGRNR